MITSPPTGGQAIAPLKHARQENPPCPPRTTAFAGQESLQQLQLVAPHLQTDGKEDQVLLIPQQAQELSCANRLQQAQRCQTAQVTVLDAIQKPFPSWKRPHGREAREKLKVFAELYT